ncbi:serine hydroxymethyltransferase, partial [Burkholderia multivorans]
DALAEAGAVPFQCERGFTDSHQFALLAAPFGGGTRGARVLEKAGILTSGIGLPVPEVPGDQNGIRLGTPEIVRRGMTVSDMPRLAGYIARALDTARTPADPGSISDTPAEVVLREIADDVAAWRKDFTGVRFTA